MSMPSDPTVYEGRLSDGRTAASLRVAVRLGERGLEIRQYLPAGAPQTPLVWPYASLRSGEPAQHARLAAVGVDDVGSPFAEDALELVECHQIVRGMNGANQLREDREDWLRKGDTVRGKLVARRHNPLCGSELRAPPSARISSGHSCRIADR